MSIALEGTIAESTTNKIADKVAITSRSGSPISKSGTFYLETIQSTKTFTGTTELYKTHHFTYSVNVNPAYYSFDKKTTCSRKWTMSYYRQNKNKTWKKTWSYITVDSTLMDMIIGAEKRIEIENTITNELLDELKTAISVIDNTNN